MWPRLNIFQGPTCSGRAFFHPGYRHPLCQFFLKKVFRRENVKFHCSKKSAFVSDHYGLALFIDLRYVVHCLRPVPMFHTFVFQFAVMLGARSVGVVRFLVRELYLKLFCRGGGPGCVSIILVALSHRPV